MFSLWVVLRECSEFVHASPRSIYTLSHVSRRKDKNGPQTYFQTSEFLRISEKVWHETHQNLKIIKGVSLKCENQKHLPFRPRCIHSGKKKTTVNLDSPYNHITVQSETSWRIFFTCYKYIGVRQKTRWIKKYEYCRNLSELKRQGH